jgi:hypothetical protein
MNKLQNWLPIYSGRKQCAILVLFNKKILESDSVKILGITLDRTMSFNKNIEDLLMQNVKVD